MTTPPKPARLRPKAQPVDHVVGVGSSAGGLEALQELLGELAPGTGAAYVVAQHLSPEHPSLIVDLLSRTTHLPVVAAVDGAPLQADTVTIAPPNCDVTVDRERLHVIEPAARFGPSPSVDLLFDSIAEHWGPSGVAVVLSGTGSDGAHGLRTVRSVGGLTMVQSPMTARFDGMPRAAITLGGADLIDDAPRLGRRLALVGSPEGDWVGDALTPPAPQVLSTVADQLRQATGIDFSRYKDSTLRRQIQRRMAIRQVRSIDDYLPMLAADGDEAHALSRNLLVTVTSFFRDPQAFEALRAQLQVYVAAHEQSTNLRVWVPGCATGEEVYTVAMLVSEVLGHPADLDRRLKVFGTDLDEGSLAIARRAVYPLVAARPIPPELRDRFIHEGGDTFQIADRLRDCTVFARHNVGEDPPFPRIDLVSCRNTLIYFTQSLQDRVLDLFRYALKPGGLLFLGTSESLGNRNQGFTTIDADQRIFARTAEAALIPQRPVAPVIERTPVVFSTGRIGIVRDVVPEQHTALLDALLRSLGRAFLVLDENHDLVEVIGDVAAYCRLPEGRMTAAVGSFLLPELRDEARALFLMCRADRIPVLGRRITLGDEGPALRMEARPLDVLGRELTMLSFLPESDSPDDDNQARQVDRDPSFDKELGRLERELLASQDTLRRSLAELEAANEELEASSEELQASSEELQSSIEELEAANEELQATNEELGALNAQLRQRGDELELLNSDLENIQASLSQGMVIVDLDLRVTRFSPLAVRVFALVDADIGQPLESVPTTLPVPGLVTALRAVIAGAPSQRIEASANGISYLAQVLPYAGPDGGIQGALITLTDVSELVVLRRAAENAVAEFAQLTDALDEAVWKREAGMGPFLYTSERMTMLTGWSPTELREDAAQFDDAIAEDDRELVRAARSSGSPGWSIMYRIRTRDDRQIWVQEVARVVDDGEHGYVVGTLADTTDRRRAEQNAADMSDVFESVFDTQVFGVAVLDADDRLVMANTTFCTLVGADPSSVSGMPLATLVDIDRAATPRTDAAPETGTLPMSAIRVTRHDGGVSWVTVESRMLPRPIGDAVAIVVIQDVTSLHEQTNLLSYQATYDSLTGLLNRGAFASALNHEIARCARSGRGLALVWIDLDHFKETNDEYGHEVGDEVLAAAADRITTVVRADDIVGRLGGDEYGVIISGYDRTEEVEAALDRLTDSLREPMTIGDREARVSGSLGVALYPTDSTAADGLIRAADAAMYSIKSRGGDGFAYFAESMNRAAEHRRRMRAAIAESITQGAFELYYQPIVASKSNVLWGAESLLRWHHDGEVITAAGFIPFCEESGQIRAIGRLTLDLLRNDLQTLRAAGHGSVTLGINMSVPQLEDRHLSESLASWPDSGDLDGLVVEVVESVFLPDNQRAMGALRDLGALGAQVAIDDYGTGYSNFTLLANLSPAFIKLDKSLLSERSDGRRGIVLFQAAVDLAHSLGALVVAEGIEDNEQRRLAVDLGADLVQGYAIAEPMPLAGLIDWLDRTAANEQQGKP